MLRERQMLHVREGCAVLESCIAELLDARQRDCYCMDLHTVLL